MCGINGFNWNEQKLICKMNDRIFHRGPNSQDWKSFEKATMGLTRLSILDLSNLGNQPMFNDDETLCIVFNGEIYNFEELRAKYCKNYPFKSKTDTEVVLAMYEIFGEDCVNYFNGMWGFCVYDLKNKLLFCSRDRLGIKPFFYYKKKDKFIFSSEIKAILSHEIYTKINPEAISSFLRYRYPIEEKTFFEDIFKLKPGHNLIYHLDDDVVEIKEYWDVPQKEVLETFNDQKISIENEIIKSVKYQMISDVEIGSILSGGLDSSLLSAIMAKTSPSRINTFTVKFPDKGFDESHFAKEVSEKYKTNHIELEINDKTFLNSMQEYLIYKDEPIGVPNEVALFLMFKKIKESSTTVVLTGEGADEIFGGYGRIFRSPIDYIKRQCESTDLTFLDFFMENYGYFNDYDLKKILKKEFYVGFKEIFKKYLEKCPRSYYDKISYLFLKIHLPGLLLRNDSSSMINSIEARVPFLDHNLVEKAFKLPFEQKNKFKDLQSIKDSVNLSYKEISEKHDIPKFILKKIAESYLPESVIYRKKQGFPLPLNNWFGGKNVDEVKSKLLSRESSLSGFFDLNELEDWILKNNNAESFGLKIWMLYSLELWLNEIKHNYPNVIFN